VPVAVITDIHGNLPAFEAVLGEIEGRGIEDVWCLGDVVGYGARPRECVELARERCRLCLLGNHDLAVLGELDIDSFSEAAAEAVEWTREQIDEEALGFLRSLRPEGEAEEIGLFHASPRDPVWEYVLSVEQADACMDVQPRRVALIGHSHVALYFGRDPEDGGPAAVHGGQAGADSRLDLSRGRWLVNPGSVGQPRDGDPRAAWLELDPEGAAAEFRRTPYDIESAARQIVEAGLPQRLAERLFVGQ
jgi:diadenosine tetraphosphatase ApaH/serine/threonine PP2A family protein phosphatase